MRQESKRNKSSPETPYKFSWLFLVQDNLLKLLASTLLVYIAIRFSSELFGQDLTMLYALFIGLGIDRVIGKLEVLQSIARHKDVKL